MAKDMASQFEEFLRNLKPADAERIHKELMQSLADDVEIKEEFNRRRTKGLRSKDIMVFTVEVRQVCTTCKTVYLSETLSSDLKPIHIEAHLCGRCKDVLGSKSVEELVSVILEKEAQLYKLDKSCEIMYRPPLLTPIQLQREEDQQYEWTSESGEAERILPETLEDISCGGETDIP